MIIDSKEIKTMRPAKDYDAGYVYALFFKKSGKSDKYKVYVKIGKTRDFIDRLSTLVEQINFVDENYSENILNFVVSDWLIDCEKAENKIKTELSEYSIHKNGSDSVNPFKSLANGKERYKNEVLYAEALSHPEKQILTEKSIAEMFKKLE